MSKTIESDKTEATSPETELVYFPICAWEPSCRLAWIKWPLESEFEFNSWAL